MFDLKVLHGSPDAALTRPFTIVLAESVAQKLFGPENLIGKAIQFGGMDALEVTAMIKDLPLNTQLNFEYLISMPTNYAMLDESSEASQSWMSVYTYALLTDRKAMEDAVADMPEFTYQFYKVSGATREALAREQVYHELIPITSIHLGGNREQEMGKNSDIVYVYIFGALALLIILIASVNFINLFSTLVIKSSKEIGLRKVIGAYRSHIFWQFLGEGIMVTFLAALLALMLCLLLIPAYNNLAELSIKPADLLGIDNLLLLSGIVVVIVLLSSGGHLLPFQAFQSSKPSKEFNYLLPG